MKDFYFLTKVSEFNEVLTILDEDYLKSKRSEWGKESTPE